ncbi:MAG: multicopper oxidase domain-containing protein [Deltaproteobacteria bacterium]|nr:multicopper oxidase domain-containing protein [Deltaproteobacteria bacterium]
MSSCAAVALGLTSLVLCFGCDGAAPVDGHHGADAMPMDAMDHDGPSTEVVDHDGMDHDAPADDVLAHDMTEHDMVGTDAMDHDGMSMVPAVIEVPASEGPFETTKATDLDPADHVVEVELEAREADIVLVAGHAATRMWTYNGQLPGPRIEAHAGDTVRVRFTNSLPEATTIHWHGIRVPAAMDGVAAMQAPVQPGATFTYEFVVPDAGTFWYHPHIRSDEQVERGLYGAFVVRGNDEPATTSDRVVVLDDVLVDDGFQLAPFSVDQAMTGRQGNLLLVNGRAHPIAPVAPGGLHRFRFVNASNARYFKLELPGKPLVQIGTDGGLIEAPRQHQTLLLVPGERADVVISTSHTSSGSLTWKTLRYDRGHGTGDAPDAALFDLRFSGGMVHVTPTLPAQLGTVPTLPAAEVTRMLMLAETDGTGMADADAGHGGHGAGAGDGGPVFSINGKVFPDGEKFTAQLGAVEAWTIHNMSMMDHPFHLHGFRFQVDGDRAWRDTINVPAMTMTTFRVRLEDHPGTWMFHCHILEHAERGMMGELTVEAP